MIDKYELIEILETLQDTGDIQFKESNKVDMVDRYLKSCEGKNGVLPLVSNSTVIETPLTYCPKCKSTDIRQYTKGTDKCNNCNHAWDIYRPFKGVE